MVITLAPPLRHSQRLFIVAALVSLGAAGCERRNGMNFSCQWIDTAPSPLDLTSDAHVQHLVDDLKIADELAIRYGDRLAGWRLTETFGVVSRHGGVKNRPAGQKGRQECLTKLLGTIGTAHAVSAADIKSVQPRLHERGSDLPVTVPVLMMLAFAVHRFTQWLGGRFDADERLGRLAATAFGSLLVPTFVVAAGSAWAILAEILRVGNEHVANRGRSEGLRSNLLVLFAIGVAAVWASSGASTLRRRAGRLPTERPAK